MQSRRLAVVVARAGLACTLGIAGPVAAGETELVSVTASGLQAAGDSNLRHGGGALSADGRYVVFHSYRASLVRQDDNGVADVFLRDLDRGETRRVSVGFDGRSADAYSESATISADGRHVAFVSPASNLVGRDGNGSADVFVWNREGGGMEIASVGAGGVRANDASVEAAISADGRFVAFTSFASNLVGNDTNERTDVFVRDRQAGYTERVSVATDGGQANGYSWLPCVSDDGRIVVFYSVASNLVAGDRDAWADIFVRDRQTRQTRRVSVAANGAAANGYSVEPALSGNGRFVAFVSAATNLVPGDTNDRIDVFVRDLETGAMERVSVGPAGAQADGGSYNPVVSRDGRYVAFESFATNLVAGDTNRTYDVYVHDRATHLTRRASLATAGAQADGPNWTPSLSADGRFVAFRSDATNLAGIDSNRSSDVYVRAIGESPDVAFTLKPSALDFGAQPVGSSQSQDFWLRNKATTALSIEGLDLRGPNQSAFSVTHACGTSVAAGDGCRIRVTFAPAWRGDMWADLKLHAGDAVRTRRLTGTGQ